MGGRADLSDAGRLAARTSASARCSRGPSRVPLTRASRCTLHADSDGSRRSSGSGSPSVRSGAQWQASSER